MYNPNVEGHTMSRIVCISNRVSLPDPETGHIKAGGLAVGVKAAMESNGGGLWFGWDGTTFEASTGKRELKYADHGDIRFLTMPLTQKEYEYYYKGMSNECLWPMMHELDAYVTTQSGYYRTYNNVNKLFARMVKPHLRHDDIIWVHDYHLLPLGRELRALGIKNLIGYYHHTPVAGSKFVKNSGIPENLKSQYRSLLDSLFYYDQVGFQSFRDFRNFAGFFMDDIETPARFHTIPLKRYGRQTSFGVFPISIETADLVRNARENASQNIALLAEKSKYKILMGAERLDYTKGLPYRLEGYHRFLKHHPEMNEHVRYHQISPLSRQDIRQYKKTIDQTRQIAERIQQDFDNGVWHPLDYTEDGLPREDLVCGFRHADIGLVTPLIDGQNLVAKEYLAAQDPHDPGVLILSKNAGAAEELQDLGVLCVDPYDPDDIATKIEHALFTPKNQRLDSYYKCLTHLRRYDIDHWAESFLYELQESRYHHAYAGFPTDHSSSGVYNY